MNTVTPRRLLTLAASMMERDGYSHAYGEISKPRCFTGSMMTAREYLVRQVGTHDIETFDDAWRHLGRFIPHVGGCCWDASINLEMLQMDQAKAQAILAQAIAALPEPELEPA